ncbi:MAG: hypothetical protein JXM72_05140 [Deltaproteobacteria bacterium]|nr:hypothetical protein [Deltaproteobacteria bacterium]
MAYGNVFSQVPNMKGISLDLPFLRVRYVKIQGDQQKQVQSDGRIQVADSSRNEEFISRPVRVQYVEPAQVTTLGLDPMVSNASVIHELVYGRITDESTDIRLDAEYPAPKEYFPPSLDLIV